MLLGRQLPESVGRYRASAIRLEDGRRWAARRVAFEAELDIVGPGCEAFNLCRSLVVESAGEEEAAEVEEEAAEREEEEGRVLYGGRPVAIRKRLVL